MVDDHKVSFQECTRLALLLIAFGSGIAVIAMISKLEENECIVLAEVTWSRCKNKNCYSFQENPRSCSYLTDFQGTACFVSCVFMLFFLAQLIAKKRYNPKWSKLLIAVVFLVYTLLALIGACILTETIRKLCKGLVESDFSSGRPCEEYTLSGFYVIKLLEKAKTASWISCCSWLILFIIQVIKIVIKSRSGNRSTNRQHQVQGDQNVDIII